MPIDPLVRSRHSLLAFCVAAAALGSARAQTAMATDRAVGATLVTVPHCKEWLGTLASPEFEGRGTGQPGFEKAANYVAAHFKSLGLEARGEKGSYFQHVPWASSKVNAAKTRVVFRKGDAEVCTIPADRLTGSASSNLAATGDVVLLVVNAPTPPPVQPGRQGDRPGAAAASIPGLDAVDVKGKVVIAYVRPAAERTARQTAMAQFAVRQGLQGKEAAAVLFVQTEAVTGGLRGGSGMGRRGGNPAAAGAGRSPVDASFGGADFDAVLVGAGLSKDMLTDAPIATVLPLQGTVEVAVEETQAPAMNVWAVLPGSDAKLKDEYVVIGSHLDHLGRRGDTISPGADDDASGTTGVMALAQMFAKNPVRPTRSILFVCFSGEENGLVGSRFFADNCPVPLASIVGELQMDMIGRDEEENVEGNQGEKAEDNRNSLHLIGTKKLAPALHDLCISKNEAAKFDIEYDQEGMYSRSDHANFARHGVPIAFFFTGLHRDYHRPSDTPDKIHYEKLLRVAIYVYDIAFELATQSSRPMIDPTLWEKFRAGSRNNAPEVPAAPMQPGAPSTGK